MNTTKTLATAILAAVVAASQLACPAESLTSLTSKLNALVAEKRKLQKQNPAVVFAETDNPARNMLKTTDQIGGKYPFGTTKINKDYYCPYCKATTAGSNNPEVELAHATGCTKGKGDEQKWRDLLKKVKITNDFDELIEEKDAEIEEVKRQIDEMKNQRRGQGVDGEGATPQVNRSSSGSSGFDGIFSMKFGTVIDVGTAEKAEYADTYVFTPKKKFRYFDSYSCMVDPVSSKEYAIRATISMDVLPELDIAKEQVKVLELLNKKYGVKAKKLSPTEYRMTFEDSAGRPVRKIFVTPDSIVAIDLALRKRANEGKGKGSVSKAEVGDDLDAL